MTCRPLRVLWVTNMFHEEGSPAFRGIFVTQQWNALHALGGVELDRVVVAQDRGWPDYVLANRRVRERWDAGRYDLVHVHYGLTGLSTLMLPTSAPLLFTFYGSDINLTLPRTLSVAVARRARLRIFVSRRLADMWPSPRNRILPNGVDFEACGPRDRNEACKSLGLDPARKWVLFGGDPGNAVKGHPVFREVLERVRGDVPQAGELVLSEPGQPYERVVTKLNAADVLLFTSRRGSEGSPTVVKEALAVGLPVVSVDVGDVAEMLRGIEPGGMIPWPDGGDPQARAAWIEALAGRTREVLECGKRSDGRAKRAFLRQEEIARRLAAYYREGLELPVRR